MAKKTAPPFDVLLAHLCAGVLPGMGMEDQDDDDNEIQGAAGISDLKIVDDTPGTRHVRFSVTGVLPEYVYSPSKAITQLKELTNTDDLQKLLGLCENINGSNSEDLYHHVWGCLDQADPSKSWALVLEGEVKDYVGEDGGVSLECLLLEGNQNIQEAIARLRKEEIERFASDGLMGRMARAVGDDPQAMSALIQAMRKHKTLGPAFSRWEAETLGMVLEGTVAQVPPRRKGPGATRL